MKKHFQSYQMLIFILGFLLVMPKSFTDKLRNYGAQSGSALYQRMYSYKQEAQAEELERLRLENILLSKQIEEVKEYLISEENIEGRFQELEQIRLEGEEVNQDKDFFIRKEKKLVARLHKYTKSIEAKIIYREPALWNQQLWVDVGQRDNMELGYDVIVHNSPVVMGNVLVGVVDYVGKAQSRIRMITDPGVCVAVRVIRGAEQNYQALEHLSKLLEQLKYRQDLFFSLEEQTNTLGILSHLQGNLSLSCKDRYLAKGEVTGCKRPSWRQATHQLSGAGFNYDYSDEEGSARDLRLHETDRSAEPLVQEGDLLVTTGMDGFFPEGIHVAIVGKIYPLEEGGIAYQLDATSLMPEYKEMRYVTILPPVHQEPFVKPSPF